MGSASLPEAASASLLAHIRRLQAEACRNRHAVLQTVAGKRADPDPRTMPWPPLLSRCQRRRKSAMGCRPTFILGDPMTLTTRTAFALAGLAAVAGVALLTQAVADPERLLTQRPSWAV